MTNSLEPTSPSDGDTFEFSAVAVFVPGGVDDVLTRIKAKVRSIKPDVSTASGRKAVASLAYKVARSKTALIGVMEAECKRIRDEVDDKTSTIYKNIKRIEDELDALKAEARKPLTDLENANKARIAAHVVALGELEFIGVFADAPLSSDLVLERMKQLQEFPQRDWQEFSIRAAELLASVQSNLAATLDAARAHESQQAELARLRAEAEERRRQEAERERAAREERLKADAAEAARKQAEAKAAREIAELERRQKAEIDRMKCEMLAAEKRAKDTAAAAAERALAANPISAGKRGDVENNKQAAIDAERKRVADLHAAKLRKDEELAAVPDQQITRIYWDICDFIEGVIGVGRQDAVSLTDALVNGNVPHITIDWGVSAFTG